MKLIAVVNKSNDSLISIVSAQSEPAARNGVAKSLIAVREPTDEEVKAAYAAGTVITIKGGVRKPKKSKDLAPAPTAPTSNESPVGQA